MATGAIATRVLASAQSPAPAVVVAEYDGVIHPITTAGAGDCAEARTRAASAAVATDRHTADQAATAAPARHLVASETR